MEDPSPSHTSATLLEMLRDPENAAAWEEFVLRYRPKIVGWCREWGVQDADADDVAQIVLVKMTEKLRGFRYDPARSFRAWLRTVTRNAWCDLMSGRRLREDARGGERLDSLEARDDLERRLAEILDRELLDAAMLRVQARVEPHTWEAFRLTAIEGLTGDEAAARLGQPVAQVFVAKHRVQRSIGIEVRRMEGDAPA